MDQTRQASSKRGSTRARLICPALIAVTVGPSALMESLGSDVEVTKREKSPRKLSRLAEESAGHPSEHHPEFLLHSNWTVEKKKWWTTVHGNCSDGSEGEHGDDLDPEDELDEKKTCENFGCHGYCPKHKCQCTDRCVDFGNCCKDYPTTCMLSDTYQQLEHALVSEEEAANDKERTMCILVLCFFLLLMALVMLVNSYYPAVRTVAYQMIVETGSIFCAATFNVLLDGFLIEQVIHGKPPRGMGWTAGPLVRVRVYIVITLGLYILFNGLMWKFRHHEGNLLVALRYLVGHAIAFAGMSLFGNWQQLYFWKYSLFRECIVFVAAVVCIGISLAVAHWWRHHMNSDEGVCWEYKVHDKWTLFDRDNADSLQDAVDEEEDEVTLHVGEHDFEVDLADYILSAGKIYAVMTCIDKNGDKADLTFKVRKSCRWIYEAELADEECASLILGFLSLQILLFAVTGHLHSMMGLVLESDVSHICWVAGAGILYLLLFVGAVLVENRCHLGCKSMDFLQGLLGMSMAWCFVRAGGMVARQHQGERTMAMLVAAVLLSFVALIFVLVVTWVWQLVDSRRARRGHLYLQYMQQGEEEEETWTLEDIHPESEVTAGLQKLNTVRMLQVGAPMAASHLTLLDKVEQADFHVHGRDALLVIIRAFGAVMGLGWDKALEGAEEATYTGWGHRVISRLVGAIVVMGIFLPGWWLYLLPKSQMTYSQHCKTIKAAKRN